MYSIKNAICILGTKVITSELKFRTVVIREIVAWEARARSSRLIGILHTPEEPEKMLMRLSVQVLVLAEVRFLVRLRVGRTHLVIEH